MGKKEELINLVAEYYGVSAEEIKSPKRDAIIVKARHVAIYLMREIFSFSYPYIGIYFGNRDHTSALHAYKKIQKNIADPGLGGEINWIRNKLENQKAETNKNDINPNDSA